MSRPLTRERIYETDLKLIASRGTGIVFDDRLQADTPRFDPLAVLPEPAAEPDWNLVKRHYRRYGNPEATAAKYGIALRDLKARARREAWS